MSVLRVSFLSHGMQLLSAGSDGLVKLWTIKSNDCIATLDAHDDRVRLWALRARSEEPCGHGKHSRLRSWRGPFGRATCAIGRA